MSADRFFHAVGHIDEDLIAEFLEQDMGKRTSPALRRAKRLWWAPIPAVAAFLCVAIGLHYLAPLLLKNPFEDPVADPFIPPVSEELQPWSPPVMGEDVPVVEVTAKVTNFPFYVFTQEVTTLPYHWYTLADGDALKTSDPLPAGNYLPIYEQRNVYSEEKLDAFIQKWLPAIQDLTGITDTEYSIQEELCLTGIRTPSQYSATIGSEETEEAICFVNSELPSLYFSCPDEAITMRSLFPNVDGTDSQEAILSSLSKGIQYLQETLGLEFQNGKTAWTTYVMNDPTYDRLYVTLTGYPPEGNEAFPYEIASAPAYRVILKYTYIDRENSHEMELFEISFYECTNSASYMSMIGKAAVLPLAQAEKLLEAGYVYNATRCLDCRAAYCDVDFSDYDSVGLVYRQGYAGQYNWCVPFYAFYKQNGDGYAVAYVPAVEVSGLEEYFAECTEKHLHTVSEETN